jgi:hypothetical protein
VFDEHLALDDGERRRLRDLPAALEARGRLPGAGAHGTRGTSIETMIFTIENDVITRIDVASNTADLVIYQYERGWPMPHNVRVDPIVAGVDHREQIAATA